MRVARLVKFFFKPLFQAIKKPQFYQILKVPRDQKLKSAVCKYVLCVINVLINFLIVQKVQLKNI